MNHAAFHVAVRRIAGRKHFSTRIEAIEHDGDVRLEYSAYLEVVGWREGPSGESVLAALLAPSANPSDTDPLPAPPLPPEICPPPTCEEERPW